MNILILSWRGPGHPLAGGAEQVTWRYATGWSKAGHKVTLFTSGYPGCISHEVKDGITIFRQGDQFVGCKIFAIYHYLFSKNKYDLIVDEHHGLPFYSPIYSKVPVMCFVHEVAGPVWRLNPWPKPAHYLPKYLGPLIEKVSLKIYRQSKFMTVSESTRKDLLSLGIKDITVIHNGINLPEKLPKKSKNSTPTFIFLSALAHDKGVEDAIYVFKYLFSRLPKSKFYIVGHGTPDYVSFLKKIANGLPITFTGFVSEQKKFELLSQSHLLIFPSAHEGWGLVIIEANSVGTPAVVYPVSGVVDSTKNNITGVIAKTFTHQSLAESTYSAFMSANYNKMSNSAIAWAKSFSWEKSISASLKLLSEISKQG